MPKPTLPVNESLRATLSEVRKELLDFGMRNPLLNYRLLKSRGLEVEGVRPADAYEALVTEGKELAFLCLGETLGASAPALFEDDEATDNGLVPVHPGRPNGQIVRERAPLIREGLPTTLHELDLEKRLLGTFYTAKTSIEEQGVNTLFLALGTLLWREPGDKEELRRAPLLLIPVELERKAAGEGFRVKYSGEDVVPNVCLIEFLKQSFGLEVEEQAESEELVVDEYFLTMGRLISKQEGWSVDPESIALGFFSFAKFLMYRDLDPATWGSEAELLNHELLDRLLGTGSFAGESSQFGEGDFIDEHLAVSKSSHVLDADSTQSLAILDVATGRNMVIQGPPGTGKSQTIVNLIAEAMASNKRVLFVAEKKAALEVVKQRLDKINLGSACLELHSNKVKKKEVIDELKRTASLQANGGARNSVDKAILEEAQKQLNEYCFAVNAPAGGSEETVRDLYGILLPILSKFESEEVPKLALTGCQAWSAVEVHRKRSVVSRLQDRLQQVGIPSRHPFWGSQIRVVLPSTRESVRNSLNEAANVAQSVGQVAEQFAEMLAQPVSQSKAELEVLCANARQMASAPDLKGIDLRDPEWTKSEAKIRNGIAAGKRYTTIRSEWLEKIKPQAWDTEISTLESVTSELGGKWWRFLSPQWKAAKREIASLITGPLPKATAEMTAILKAIHAVRESKAEFESYDSLLSSLFGQSWVGESSDWKLMARHLDWITSTVKGVRSGQFEDWCLVNVQRLTGRKELATMADEAEGLLAGYEKNCQRVIDVLKLDASVKCEIRARHYEGWTVRSAGFWNGLASETNEIGNLAGYGQVRDECQQENLNAIAILADGWASGKDRLFDVFEYARVSAMLDSAFEAHPALARFEAFQHNTNVQAFRQLDARLLDWTCISLAQSHASAIPRAATSNGQIGVLWREFEKKARHLPIRKLILKAGNAIQAIKPVFMMSPLSVANFLAPMTVQFELVIFDEASQVKPADALGAIVRGKQAVVVGDSKQLPPTSFFESMVAQDAETEEDDAVATSDIESILGLFCSRGAHQRMLRWHYRSKHESLIAVSNHLFYDDRLVVFPSPDRQKESVGLVYCKVEKAPYDRSKTRTNPGEAKAVAEAVMKHAIEQLRSPKEHRLTLGVAALSVAQRDAILDQLEILRRRSPGCEEFFMSPPHEQFFVKNLENVQGDERDVIFISIGYGRTAEGYLAMSFGPVNRAGGERRLNVLFSRARKRCEVFTTLCADDIDDGGNTTGGVHALKSFLRYAESGYMDVPVATGRPPDSPFEEQVLRELERLGYTVHTQVGTVGFYLDMAVVDPLKPGRYLLGIECDGAAYHSARSTRDRDRLRQLVLESLGWKIHRIWSTAWFREPAAEIEALCAAIEEAKKKPESPATVPFRDSSFRESEAKPSVAGVPERPSSAPRAQGYVFAELEINLGFGELHAQSLETLTQWLATVVTAESPIHWLEASRRIANAAGVQRVGSRIQEAFKRACRSGSRSKKFVYREGFLWADDSFNLVVRDRSEVPAQFKRLDCIAPEEIKAAIEQSVGESFGLLQEDVATSACRLLGFARVSEDMRLAVEQLRDAMIKEGRLTLQGETVTRDARNTCSN
jgi:very-short-patch-repair endonuclease